MYTLSWHMNMTHFILLGNDPRCTFYVRSLALSPDLNLNHIFLAACRFCLFSLTHDFSSDRGSNWRTRHRKRSTKRVDVHAERVPTLWFTDSFCGRLIYVLWATSDHFWQRRTLCRPSWETYLWPNKYHQGIFKAFSMQLWDENRLWPSLG